MAKKTTIPCDPNEMRAVLVHPTVHRQLKLRAVREDVLLQDIIHNALCRELGLERLMIGESVAS